MSMQSYAPSAPVIQLDENSRGRFVARAYNHLFGAILAFIAIEVVLFKTGLAESIASVLLSGSWLLVLGGFMVVSWIARYAAHNAQSLAAQYAALAAYVVGQAIIFVPLLYLAEKFAPGAIGSAALVTFLGFVGLSLVAFFTRKDFSFLRGLLCWGGVMALVLIVAAVVFGLNLGTWFSLAMVGLAGAAILHDTSNILYHYPENRYVAAAIELFASVALMLWYVLRIFMSRR
jgi:FtsH-binding integral membrane protein